MARGGGPGVVDRPRACTEAPCARTGRSRDYPWADGAQGPRREVRGRNPPMNGHGKSHRPVVPAKPSNKEGPNRSGSQGEPQTGTNRETGDTAKGEPRVRSEGRKPTAEGVEGRGLAKGNPSQQNMLRTQDRVGMPSALERIGEIASHCATPPQHLRQEPSALVPQARICAGGAGQPASLPRSLNALSLGLPLTR